MELEAISQIDPDAPVGSIVGLTIEGTAFVAAHHAHGWVLFEDRCPHAGCAFAYDGEIADGTTLVCACHGSEFDLQDGSVLEGPATRGLSLTPLATDGERLTIEEPAPDPRA
jgi:nitrite reductase/ring-hydroxylating ferredoxin subunit